MPGFSEDLKDISEARKMDVVVKPPYKKLFPDVHSGQTCALLA